MRRAWVLAVLLLAACGAAGEGASPPASPERPCERRAPRIRATQPEEPAAGAGESTEATLPDETAPDDSASQHRALVVGRIVDARGEPVSDAHVVAFIGVDTMIVAPREIGEGAKTGAGAVVTKDVPAGKLAVGVPARILEQRPKRAAAEDTAAAADPTEPETGEPSA